MSDLSDRLRNLALYLPEQRSVFIEAATAIDRLIAALTESLTDNAWNAYNCGITRDGKWMDGGMSDAEWLQRELGLEDGWHHCAEIQRRIPEVVRKQIDALSLPSDQLQTGE